MLYLIDHSEVVILVQQSFKKGESVFFVFGVVLVVLDLCNIEARSLEGRELAQLFGDDILPFQHRVV
jgi:hypothetical protein